jgi:hypothetical protein
MYMPGIINLAEQYTNSVFNSKVFVRITIYKKQNDKQLFIMFIAATRKTLHLNIMVLCKKNKKRLLHKL